MAFAAIQGLNHKLEVSNAAMKKEIAELKSEAAVIQVKNAELTVTFKQLAEHLGAVEAEPRKQK